MLIVDVATKVALKQRSAQHEIFGFKSNIKVTFKTHTSAKKPKIHASWCE